VARVGYAAGSLVAPADRMTAVRRRNVQSSVHAERAALFGAALALALAARCRRDPPPQVAYGPCPPGQFCPAGPGGPQQPGPQPVPGPAPTSPPAFGLPCATDVDLQCPLSRCLGGRCGGCRSSADCKQGSSCGWTPLGMACVPGFAAPGPAPAPAPGPAGAPPFPGSFGSDPYASARQQCVDRTNNYRASVGARPVSRVAQAESCLDQQARHDGTTGEIHGAFGRCNEGAQNECPGWRGPPDSMVGPCLQMMFDEGPGPGAAHGHYTNMVNPQYTGVACGFHVTADGRVWLIQDFF
jgi:hypothetical protein